MIGAGESATAVAGTIRPGAVRVIAINRSFELVPWAEVLYAADSGFWRHYKEARSFKGWRYSADDTIRYIDPTITHVTIARDRRKGTRLNEMIKAPIGTVGAGGNSGFQAVNLAVQFGASRVLLCLDYRGKHWHPDHPHSMRNPDGHQLKTWADHLDRQAPLLRSWGVEVINVAKNSALRAFPYADCGLFNSNECSLPA